jgi:signal transduction histidine kinase
VTERRPPAVAPVELPAEASAEASAEAPAGRPQAAPVATVDQPTAAYPLVTEAAPEPAPAPAGVPGLAGDVAVEVSRQLADPARTLRDRLGLVVDHLERHVATSTGPTPYPWRSLQTLRQDLAAAYLEATSLARRIDELDRALRDDPPGWFDPTAAVELGLHLAGHHLGAGIELLIDLANTPPVRGVAGTVARLVAQLVAASARSARDLPGSTVSVRVAAEAGCALIAIADNGAGSPRAAGLGELARGLIAPWGGTVDAASLPGAGTTFELRLAALDPG